MREERKRDVEEHVKTVNQMLVESGAIDPEDVEEDSQGEGSDEWDGFPDQPNLEMVDHEEEYIDEDRYTTVTVESVSVSRDGFEKPVVRGAADDEEADEGKDGQDGATDTSKTEDTRPKRKKKKFRYESKLDRKLTERKQRIKKAKR
jgi:ribosomal RNA-processing protein 17